MTAHFGLPVIVAAALSVPTAPPGQSRQAPSKASPSATQATDLRPATVTVRVSDQTPYQGEPVVVELSVRYRRRPGKTPVVDDTALLRIGARRLGPVGGVRAQGADKGPTAPTASPGFVYRFRYRLVPRAPGQLTIPAVTVRVGDGAIVRSGAELLLVRPLPHAGRPSTFTGGVGQFRVEVSANPRRLELGQALRLTVRVVGRGNIEDLSAPNLAAQAAWSADFDVDRAPEPPTVEAGSKLFIYRVRPKRAGLRVLPPVAVGFFEPAAGRFQECYSQPVAIEVVEPQRLSVQEILGGASRPIPAGPGRGRVAGPVASYAGTALLRPEGPPRVGRAGWLSLALLPALLWLATWQLRRLESPRDRGHGRRGPASPFGRAWLGGQWHWGTAGQRLRQDAAHRSPSAIAEEAMRLLRRTLARSRPLPAGELTAADARRHLADWPASQGLSQRVEELIRHCDQARFGDQTGLTATELVDRLEPILAGLQQSLHPPAPPWRRWPVSLAGPVILAAVSVGLIAWLAGVGRPNAARTARLALAQKWLEAGLRQPDAPHGRRWLRRAIAQYQALLAGGLENGRLYYNLATAYAAAGDLVHARLFYLLAAQLRPRDRNVWARLATVRPGLAESPGPDATTGTAARPPSGSRPWLTVRQRLLAAVAGYCAGWALLVCWLWGRRRWMLVSGSALLVAALAAGAAALAQAEYERSHPIGVLASHRPAVYDEPSFTCPDSRPVSPGTAFRLLEPGSPATDLPGYGSLAMASPGYNPASSGAGIHMPAPPPRWLHILLPDGSDGWVSANQAFFR